MQECGKKCGTGPSGAAAESGVFQHLQEHAVHGLGGVGSVPGQGVGIDAERVHVCAVAYQGFDFPGGQRLDHRHERVAQLVQAARGQAIGSAVGFPALVIVLLVGDSEHAAAPARGFPLFIQDVTGQGRQLERPHRIFVLALGLFAPDVDGAADVDHVAVNVCPIQADYLTGPQAGQDLEPVGVYVLIFHDLASVCGRVHIEQLHKVGRLQDYFALVPGPGGDFQFFRDVGGQPGLAAVFTESPEISGQQLEHLAAAPGGVCRVDDLLQVLICQLIDPPGTNGGQNPVAPAAFRGPVVGRACRLLYLMQPQRPRCGHPRRAGGYAVI